jgi:hypothetical protein
MTAAVIDYFNISDTVDAERLFRGTVSPGPDIDYLRQSIDDRRIGVKEWLGNTFSVDDQEAERVLAKFEEYLTTLDQAVAPGHDDSDYWQFFSEMVEERDDSAFEQIDRLVEELEAER